MQFLNAVKKVRKASWIELVRASMIDGIKRNPSGPPVSATLAEHQATLPAAAVVAAQRKTRRWSGQWQAPRNRPLHCRPAIRIQA
jgi:hypothetical protein